MVDCKKATTCVLRWLADNMDALVAGSQQHQHKDAKNRLQEFAQCNNLTLPQYRTLRKGSNLLPFEVCCDFANLQTNAIAKTKKNGRTRCS